MCIHGDDCIRCLFEDVPEPIQLTPKQRWEQALDALGGGSSVLRNPGLSEAISPWHEGCPTGCLPCRCEVTKVIKNKDKPHEFYGGTCMHCSHSSVYIESFGPKTCKGMDTREAIPTAPIPRPKIKRSWW